MTPILGIFNLIGSLFYTSTQHLPYHHDHSKSFAGYYYTLSKTTGTTSKHQRVTWPGLYWTLIVFKPIVVWHMRETTRWPEVTWLSVVSIRVSTPFWFSSLSFYCALVERMCGGLLFTLLCRGVYCLMFYSRSIVYSWLWIHQTSEKVACFPFARTSISWLYRKESCRNSLAVKMWFSAISQSLKHLKLY